MLETIMQYISLGDAKQKHISLVVSCKILVVKIVAQAAFYSLVLPFVSCLYIYIYIYIYIYMISRWKTIIEILQLNGQICIVLKNTRK